MKKLIISLLALTFTISAYCEVTNNFESGNRAIDKNNCWQFSSTNITASKEMEGNYNNQTGILSSGIHYLISPWVKFSKSGMMTFSHRMNANNGNNRLLIVYLMDQADQIVKTLYTYDYKGDKTKEIDAGVEINLLGIFRIKWEFTGSGGSSRGLLDLIYIPGDYFSDPTHNDGSGNCSVYSPKPDADYDGVADVDDAYPDDPYRAYNNQYPAQEWGSLGFEDLWPSKGDYDFNDLVVDYRCTVVTDGKNEIVELKASFITRALGASFRNAFAMSLTNIPSASVISVSNSFATAYAKNYFKLQENGVEEGQTWATIIAYEDAFGVLPHPGSGTGVNTSPGALYVEPKQVDILISLKEKGNAIGNPIKFTEWPQSNINFFIVVKSNVGRGIEVHLPDYHPTDLADRNLFGQKDDGSNLDQSYTYRSKTNLPWVINVLGSFAYPVEKADVVKAHLKFGEWAESGGLIYRDWYQDLYGYSNKDLKYSH